MQGSNALSGGRSRARLTGALSHKKDMGEHMISGEKILVTGVTGGVARPIAEYLARNNEVWGAARFLDKNDPARSGREIRVCDLAGRDAIEAAGIRTCQIDLSSGDLTGLPDDFTYVIHGAFARIPNCPEQFEIAFRTNADGPGFIWQHCRKARAALLISAGTIYAPNEDTWHRYTETDPLGGAKAHWSPASPASKIMTESVVGFCARAFNVPTTIARLFMPWGHPNLGPSLDIERIRSGEEIMLVNGPQPQTLIHIDDICDQLEAMLGSAGVPPLVTNWAGDDEVSSRDWCEIAARKLGIEARFHEVKVPGAHGGFLGDATKRRSITGPCRVKFADAYDRLIEAHHT
jgi:nucleoside-diphosphate-sugar epimerase